MAETDLHWHQIVLLRYAIELKLRAVPDVYVGSDLLLYYAEGRPAKSVAPDVFAVLGAKRGSRRTWLAWEEGRLPDVVFEVSSRGTADEDLGTKKGLYEYLGVREYFIVDPEHAYLKPPLQGFRLGDEGYVRMMGDALRSEVLGLDIRWFRDAYRLFDSATGELMPSPTEAYERAEQERERAEQERERADTAERELARLRALLAERSG